MECEIVRKFFAEHDCDRGSDAIPAGMREHIGNCGECRKYYQLAVALNSRKGSLEKAPPEMLSAIESRIIADSGKRSPVRSFDGFRFLLKPAFAGFAVMLVTVMSYTFLANRSIGHVKNLSERFNIAGLKNIKSGDVLYSGDNTTAAISLENNNELQLHANTMVRMKSARSIALSRGEISVLSGDDRLEIVTPAGLLTVKNTEAKIHTVARLEKGAIKTRTTCIVLRGELIIKAGKKETMIRHGQKVVMAENGVVEYRELLAGADDKPAGSPGVSRKLFAAVEALCDCLSAAEYTRAKKGNHVLLFGREVNENKFKVRVFWPEKGLNEMACGILDGTNIPPNNTRRVNGS